LFLTVVVSVSVFSVCVGPSDLNLVTEYSPGSEEDSPCSITHSWVPSGLFISVPQIFKSVQVLDCELFIHSDQSLHSQFSIQGYIM